METNYMKYIVYQTVNKINGMLYVGVHKTENPNVWDRYIGGGIYVGYNIKNPKTVYQYALKKYGYGNFIRTVLFTYDTEKEAYNKEAEIVNKDWVKSRNTYNTQTGGLSGIYRGKRLYQFDYNGNLIKEWDSYKEASEYFGVHHARFRDAVNNKYSACESYWSSKKEINISEYKLAYHSEIYQFSNSGDFIKTWKSTTEICKEMNIKKSTILEAIYAKKMFRNCWWIKDKYSINDIIKYNREFSVKSAVNVYSVDGELLAECSSLKHASIQFQIPYDQVKWSARSGKIYNGYIFKKISKISRHTKIKQFDLDGNLIKIWDSLTACTKKYPKCREVLKGVRNHTHGFKFEYILE